MKLFWHYFIAISSLLSLAACAPIHVEDATPTASIVDGTEDADNVKFYDATITIPRQQTRPLDILWVIDNSGSMTAEAGHVRNNFLSFINTVKTTVDLKVGLISSAGSSGNNVSLPLTGPQYLQINQVVGSHNSLLLTASALCPATNAGPECQAITSAANIRGMLQPFFRQDSKKVLVFVTDDNSVSMTSSKFKAVWNEIYGAQSPFTAFGFIALSASQSPCMAAVGSVYMQLTSPSGGQNFNICDTDWTDTFNKLTNNVLVLSLQPIALPDSVKQGQILGVIMNGQTLLTSQYSITPEGLVLSPTVVTPGQLVQIRINYK